MVGLSFVFVLMYNVLFVVMSGVDSVIVCLSVVRLLNGGLRNMMLNVFGVRLVVSCSVLVLVILIEWVLSLFLIVCNCCVVCG